MKMNKNFKKAILFIGLTFLVNWLMAILFFVFWPGSRGIFTLSARIMLITYMFMPMVVAIIVQKFIYKEPVKKPLGISLKLNRWFLVAWLLPAVIAFASLGVSLLLPGVEYSTEITGTFERLKSVYLPEQLKQMEDRFNTFPIHPFWIFLFLGLIAGPTINAITGFGEELGWRGFLQKALGYLGFWKSSAIIGVIWGVWHAPTILLGYNYPQYPIVGIFMMTILCILLAPIFSYVRLKAKSVIAAAIIHGSFNAVAGLWIMVVKGGNDFVVGVAGLAGFIVLAFVNIGLLLYDRLLTKEPIMVG